MAHDVTSGQSGGESNVRTSARLLIIGTFFTAVTALASLASAYVSWLQIGDSARLAREGALFTATVDVLSTYSEGCNQFVPAGLREAVFYDSTEERARVWSKLTDDQIKAYLRSISNVIAAHKYGEELALALHKLTLVLPASTPVADIEEIETNAMKPFIAVFDLGGDDLEIMLNGASMLFRAERSCKEGRAGLALALLRLNPYRSYQLPPRQ